MSREQRQALDEVLRKAPQPFGPVPVEKMREGFAAVVGSFPVAAGCGRRRRSWPGGPRSWSCGRWIPGPGRSCTFTAAATCSARLLLTG